MASDQSFLSPAKRRCVNFSFIEDADIFSFVEIGNVESCVQPIGKYDL